MSLGCAKNTVDSESIAQLLIRDKYTPITDPDQAEILIVNTCGFIGPAKEESYQALEQLAEGKQDGQLLIAAGCLSQRYGEEWCSASQYRWSTRYPPLDGYSDLVGKLRSKHPEPIYHLPTGALTVGTDEKDTLRVSADGPSAYIKIADGCRRPCAFWRSRIKGTLVSRPVEAILHEAQTLQGMGTRELILIAQDTTDYGHDLGIKNGLAHLLEHYRSCARNRLDPGDVRLPRLCYR